MSLLRIRPAKPEDAGFVIGFWIDSYLQHSEIADLDRDIYKRLMRLYLKRLFREPGMKVFVSCDPSDEDTLVGFVAGLDDELHYVYVRDGFRRMGHARELFEKFSVAKYAMLTEMGEKFIKPAERGWEFTPRLQTFLSRHGWRKRKAA